MEEKPVKGKEFNKILIIDDDLAIRFVLKKLFSKYLSGIGVKIYTSPDGVQGLGYAYLVRPDLILIDSTLPKYSGRELIEYLITNEKFSNTPVILINEDGKQYDNLQTNYSQISKKDKSFPYNLLRLAVRKINKEKEKETRKSRSFRFMSFLSKGIIKYSNISDINAGKIDNKYLKKKNIFKKTIYATGFVINQILTSIYLSMFYLLIGRGDYEESIEQRKQDLATFRSKVYPAIAVSIATLAVLTLSIVLVIGTVIGAVMLGKESTSAATSYNWDGGGTDGTCGGAAGDGNKWSCAANWSPDGVPVAADSVTFNGTSIKDVTVDASAAGTITTMTIASGYSGTVSLSRSLTVTTFSQATGNFNAGSQILTIQNFTLNGGVFTASSGNMNVSGAFTVSGSPSFNANGGSITFTGGTATATCGGITFNSVTITKTNQFTINSTCSFPLGNNPTVTTSSSNLILNGTLSGSGTFTYTSGGQLQLNAGSNFSGFTGLNITGGLSNAITSNFSSFTPFNLTGPVSVTAGSLSLPVPTGSVAITNFSLTGGTFTAPASNITVSGAFTISGSSTFNANSGSLTFIGQTATAACNGAVFNSVTISKSNQFTIGADCSFPLGSNPTVTTYPGDLTLSGTLSGSGTLTHATGGQLQLAAGSSLSGFSGLNEAGGLTNATTSNFSGYTTFNLAGNVSVTAGSLSLPVPTGSVAVINFSLTGGTFTAPAANITVSGSFTISGASTFNANGGSITFTGGSGATAACNGAIFNSVAISRTNQFTIGADCSFPLGNNPTVTTSTGDLILNGTLSGTGTLTHITGGALQLRTGSSLSGFTGLNEAGGLTNASTSNFSGYTTFNLAGPVSVTAGSLSLPVPTGSIALSSFSLTGGTFTAPAANMTVSAGFTISGTSTFNANGGTITFMGSTIATVACNNATFNKIVIAKTSGSARFTNCTLPLGNDPTASVASSYDITLNSSTISGTGILTMSSGTFILNASAAVTGFTELQANNLTVSGATANFASYTTVNVGGAFVISSGSFAGPGVVSVGTFSQSGGTMTAPSTLNVSGDFTYTTGTFTPGSGTVNFNGGTATLSCTSLGFNRVSFSGQTGVKTVSSNCNLPLGNNPTIDNGITLSGTLTGTGTITHTTGILTVNSTGVFSGFTGLTGTSNALSLAANTNLNMSGFSSVTLGSNFTENLASETFTAPSGTFSVAGNFVHSAGTFNHNNGTVNLNGSSQTITGATTFYNLTKTMSAGPAQTLTFQNSVAQTVLGTLTFHGYDVSNRLLLRSNSTSRFNIDPQGTRDMQYLDISYANNVNAATVEMAGTGSVDSGNNLNFSFGNTAPIAPTSLGPISVISGTLINDTTPDFNFTLNDPNLLDTVKFNIQIATDSGFTSKVVDYTSDLGAKGVRTFTVGQALGGGTYTTGSPSQQLTSGSYFWKVNNTDNSASSSLYTTANSGNVAFILDIDPPSSFTPTLDATSPTNNQHPVLTYSTTDNVMIDHYEVQIDLGTYVAQSSPYTMDLSVGDHIIRVRAYDTAGNYRDGTELNLTVDISQPDAFTPTLNVTSPTSNSAPILSFSTTDAQGINHYEVKIDTGSYVTQTSPYQLSTLSEGLHTFTVIAFDNTGNTRESDQVQLIVDLTSPDAFVAILTGTSPINDPTPEISFSTSDGIGVGHYEVSVDAGGFATHSSPYTLPLLIEGSHTVTVRAFDNAGNHMDSSELNFYIDLTLPEAFTPTLNVSSPTNNNAPIVSFVTTDDIAISHYEVNVNSGGFSTQSSPYQLPSLDDGSHTILVKAFDTAGNSTQGSVNVMINTSAPEAFTINFNVDSPTNNTTPTITFFTTAPDGINRYEVRVDSGIFSTHESPYTLPTLAAGERVIQVRAFDNAGNYTDAIGNITIDIAPPNDFTLEIFDGSPTKDTTPSISFSTTDNIDIDYYEASVDSGSFVTLTSPYILSILSEGSHSITVRAYDTAGNSTDGTLDFDVDITDPIINYDAPTLVSDTAITDTALIITDNFGISTSGIQVIGGSKSCTQTSAIRVDCSISITESGNLSITATDLAANQSTTTISGYVIDTIAPVIVITAPTKTNSVSITDTTVLITDNYSISRLGVSATGGTISCTQINTTNVNCTSVISSSGDFTINAEDSAGNTASVTESEYTVSGTAPDPFAPVLNTSPYTSNTTPEVSFVAFDNDGIDHYEVSIDTGSFATHSSPYTLPVLSEGLHTIRVRAFDPYDNFREASVTVTIDITNPNEFTPVLIGSPVTNDQRPTITFSTTDNIGIDHYEVKVDDSFYIIESSPYQLPILSEGPHVITVKAVDHASNFFINTVNVTLDTTPPLPFTVGLSTSSPTNDTTPNIIFDATDAVAIDHYELQMDSGSYATRISPYTSPTLADGSHAVTVAAFDTVGNSRTSSLGFVIDTQTPVISYSAPTLISNNAITNTVITVTDNYAVNVADISSTGGTLSCSQTSTTEVNCTTVISASGNLTITAHDQATNSSAAMIAGYIIENDPPVITFTAPTKISNITITDTVIKVTNNYAMIPSGVSATGGDISCVQVNGAEISCQASISKSGDLVVTASDVEGNVATATEAGYEISSVFELPAAFKPTLNTGFYTNNKTPIVSFSTTDPSGINYYEVRVDNGTFNRQSSPYTLPNLEEGAHAITVRAFNNHELYIDGTVNVVIDTVLPDFFEVKITTGSPTKDTTPTITYFTKDNIAINYYEVQIDSENFTKHNSPYTISKLNEGNHKITVRALDLANNYIDATTNIVIDTTAPEGKITINNDEEQTFDKEVNLIISASDKLSDVSEMMLSEDKTFTGASYEPFTETKPWLLSNQEGDKVIYIKFKDKAENESKTFSDSIKFGDKIEPANKDSRKTEVSLLKTVANISPAILIPATIFTVLVNLSVYINLFKYSFFFIRIKNKLNLINKILVYGGFSYAIFALIILPTVLHVIIFMLYIVLAVLIYLKDRGSLDKNQNNGERISKY